MSDLIDRQAAIDEFDGVKVDEENCNEYDIGFNDGVDLAISILSVLPSAQQWISCSERMPDDTEEVLTTYIVNGNPKKRYVETATYYGEDGWSSPCDEYRVIGTRVDVIAWMPLPNPYKGGTDG